jgi:Flp pilus assembly CpaE family ATPase
MSPPDFHKALGHKVEFLIPLDEKAFKQAANNGKPVVQIDARSKASKTMQSIAAKLTGEKQSAKSKDKRGDKGKPEKKSSWSQMFKKG